MAYDMIRFFFILFAGAGLFADSAAAVRIGAKAGEHDLRLDEENIKKSNALGYYARSVFLAYQGASIEKIKASLARALNELPESDLLLNEAATPYLRQGDFKGLVAMLTPVAYHHPDALSLHVFLGFMCRRADMPAEGARVFEHIFYDLKTHEPFVIRELAALYWASDSSRKIPVLLRRANRIKALKNQFVIDFLWTFYYDGMASRKRKGGLLTVANRYQRQAVGHARRAAERYGPGESLKSCDSLIGVLTASGDYRAAARLLEKAARQFPGQRMAILIRRAECLADGGDPETAGDQIHALSMQTITNARLLMRVGQVAIQIGDLNAARQAYAQAVREEPDNPSIRYAYAVILEFTGDNEGSLAILNALAELNADWHMRKTRILTRLKRWGEAKAAWETAGAIDRAAKRDTRSTVSYLLLGATIETGLNHTGAAIVLARKALETDPENPLAANYLGYMLADAGRRLSEAERLIRSALAKDPENDAYLDSLAWVCFRRKRYVEAGQAMAHCLRLAGDDNDSVILDHAGDIFAANNAHRLARCYWRQALRRHPDHPARIHQKINRETPTKL